MDSFDKECPRCYGKGLAAPQASTPVAPPTVAPVAAPVATIPQKPDAKNARACIGTGCGLVLLFFIGLIVLGSLKGKPDASKSLGYQYAKAAITRQLKAPTTAKFPASYEKGVIIQEVDGELHIAGFVESQNSFGAMIRSRWSARLKRTSDRKSWEVIEASLAE